MDNPSSTTKPAAANAETGLATNQTGQKQLTGWHYLRDEERAALAKVWVKTTLLDLISKHGIQIKSADKMKGADIPFAAAKPGNDLSAEDGLEVKICNVSPLDAALALYREDPTRRICVHSFADAIVPGGKFLSGSNRQESEFCIRTSIYRTLPQEDYPLEWDELLYSTDVVHLVLEPNAHCDDAHYRFTLDMISSAPQEFPQSLTTGQPKAHTTDYLSAREKNRMRQQVILVLRAAAHRGAQVVVLGSFGCGPLRHPVHAVAEMVREVILNPVAPDYWYLAGIKTVVVAVWEPLVPKGLYTVFKKAFAMPGSENELLPGINVMSLDLIQKAIYLRPEDASAVADAEDDEDMFDLEELQKDTKPPQEEGGPADDELPDDEHTEKKDGAGDEQSKSTTGSKEKGLEDDYIYYSDEEELEKTSKDGNQEVLPTEPDSTSGGKT